MLPLETWIRDYLPTVMPSGWSRLTGKAVRKENGHAVMAYAGSGLIVTAHAAEMSRGRLFYLDILRRNGIVSQSDIKSVVFGLYRGAPWLKALFENLVWSEHPTPKESVAFTFMAEIVPYEMDVEAASA